MFPLPLLHITNIQRVISSYPGGSTTPRTPPRPRVASTYLIHIDRLAPIRTIQWSAISHHHQHGINFLIRPTQTSPESPITHQQKLDIPIPRQPKPHSSSLRLAIHTQGH
eukprot:193845_1